MSSAAKSTQTNRLVERLDELPTLPAIVYELSRIINDPMSSTSDVEKVMANDQSMTTKVLKLANSAYYAIPGGVSSLQRVIAYIGYDTIQQLVLSASIINALKVKGPQTFDLNQFWKHSMGVAMASEIVAKAVGYKNPGDLFTSGLVHDMGKMAIFIIDPDTFLAAVAGAREKELSLHEAEIEMSLPRHTEIGCLLAQKWKLPTSIQAVTTYHHRKEQSGRGGLSAELNQVVDIVYLANLLIHALQFGNSGHGKILGMPKDVMERMNLSPDAVKGIVTKIKEAIADAENFLKIIGG